MNVADMQIWLNNKIKLNNLNLKPLVVDGIGGPITRNQKTLEFIEKAIKIHGNKFDYSLVDYKNSKKKVNFLCNSCKNIFEQIPNGHLSGRGCSKCSKALCGYKKEQFVARAIKNNSSKFYVLKCFNETEEFYKIGITSTGISNRYHCKATLPYNYEIVIDYDNEPDIIYDLEKKLLKELFSFSYKPLIYFKGISECFDTNENVLKIIKGYTI